jgi:UDP-N-acetylglucosamine 2-epimerase (non-hydrolysing)
MRVSVIFGTRPEAIKLAPVILRLKQEKSVECRVCVTAQHRDLLDQVMEVFGIESDHDLNLMQADQTLASLTAAGIQALDAYLRAERPDLVVVQGDTTTTFIASLAAFYNRVPIAHVEAGLRTGDLTSPWPEEANRVLTSHLAQFHFAPTERNRRNLLTEGIRSDRIYVTGNTVIDALLMARARIASEPPKIPGIEPGLMDGSLPRRVVLVTAHRRESFGEPLASICTAVRHLASTFPDTHFIYPVHPNPNVRRVVDEVLGGANGNAVLENVHLIEPLGYLPFVALMDRATLILTDSGGVQEEAPSLGKPVLVMRETTERPEAVEAGAVRIVGTKVQDLVQETSLLLTDDVAYKAMATGVNPYGDGLASLRIVNVLLRNALRAG